jgi:acyl-CoA synthetase (AMP-forming)/AMP-acid ligase II
MIKSPAEAKSLVDIVQFYSNQKGDDIAYVYLVDGEEHEARITFAELDRQSRAFAATLQKFTQPGGHALLLYPSGLEFIVAFLGCLYAGVVAIPTIVPHLKRATPRFRSMLGDAQAVVACTQLELFDKLKLLFEEYPEFHELKWVVNEQIETGVEVDWKQVNNKPDELAFLQYTSGSTSTPKGVMITHLSLLETIRDLQQGCAFDDHSTMASWLPIFHDLGLISGLLMPLYSGRPSYFMAPIAFLEKPYRWLQAISKFKATHSAAPNFSYDLCAQKVTDEEKVSLDLSSIKIIGNAAEPVRLETMQMFSDAFKSCGFDFNLFAPAYGLAEATVKVSSRIYGQDISYCTLDADALAKHKLVYLPEEDPKGYVSVGCGGSSIDAEILIVNPQTKMQCPVDEVGEIWVKSSSIAQGYWGRPEETEKTFRAHLLPSNEGPFMRTGDLGFFHNGQLHITGRIKDMVIIQGRNFYPQDIELTIEKCHPALRPSFGAAFAVEDNQVDHLVVVQEVKREFRKSDDFEGIANAIRMAVAKNHGLRVQAVVLIMPSTIQKTTSGKIQRNATRDTFLSGDLETLYEWRAPGIFKKSEAKN